MSSSHRMHRASPLIDGGQSSRVEDYTEVDGNDHQHRLSPSALLASRLSLSQEIPPDVVYRQLYQLRMNQLKQGVDLSGLSRVQWGLQQLKFSHHIVLKKSPFRCVEIPVMFRVTVCKSCCPCQDMSSTFLGVYGDQESALLVNDVHEILNGRTEKLSVLRKEDAMFFHHLTAKTLNESEGTLLPASPVLSVLEKLRIDSANAILVAAAALEEKKRKRSSTIDILIESSLSLSMTSRDNSSSNGEGEEDEDVDDDDIEGEEEDENNENGGIYSSSSTYRNHAPFSSYPVKTDISKTKLSSPDSKYVSVERAIVTVESIVPLPSHSIEKVKPLQPQSLPRTRESNRPRASTFSVVSSAHTQSNAQSLLDNEAERTPMGLVTWLASLEDDDFVAAKLLSELCSKDKNEDSIQDPESTKSSGDIPRYRGAVKSLSNVAITTTATTTTTSTNSGQRHNYSRGREDGSEPPTQRRRRANSVIEVMPLHLFFFYYSPPSIHSSVTFYTSSVSSYLSAFPSLSLSPSLSPSHPLSRPLSLSLSLFLSLTISPYLSDSLSHPLSLSLSRSRSLCFSLSVSLTCLCSSHSLSLSLPLCIYLALIISVSLTFSLSRSLLISLSHIRPYLPFFLLLCLALSLSVFYHLTSTHFYLLISDDSSGQIVSVHF